MMRVPSGKVFSYKWNVPTEEYFFDQRLSAAEAKSTMEGGESKIVKYAYEIIGDEVLTVGPCAIKTKHYKQTLTGSELSSEQEYWLSPDLQQPLKAIITNKFKSGTRTNALTAQDVTLDFAAMR